MPASVSVIDARTSGNRLRRGRRCAAADADVQPVPPHEQPLVASDDAGRVAARHRTERGQPDARPAGRRAVQRSVRWLGVLDARARSKHRSHRSGGWVQLEPVRQLRHGRCDQRGDGRRRDAHARPSDAVRQLDSPKFDVVGSDAWGSSVCRGWQGVQAPRASRRSSTSIRPAWPSAGGSMRTRRWTHAT